MNKKEQKQLRQYSVPLNKSVEWGIIGQRPQKRINKNQVVEESGIQAGSGISFYQK